MLHWNWIRTPQSKTVTLTDGFLQCTTRHETSLDWNLNANIKCPVTLIQSTTGFLISISFQHVPRPPQSKGHGSDTKRHTWASSVHITQMAPSPGRTRLYQVTPLASLENRWCPFKPVLMIWLFIWMTCTRKCMGQLHPNIYTNPSVLCSIGL